jgi:hypothetical protein
MVDGAAGLARRGDGSRDRASEGLESRVGVGTRFVSVGARLVSVGTWFI